MKLAFPCFLILTCFGGSLLAADKPNVVLLMADDLAATLGCYGYPAAKTPHLDRLAARSVLFERAYCQFPHCNPSRASMLSGLRPNVTKVTNNADNLYDNLPGVITLPHHFRQHGYTTARCGKIFHLGVPSGLESMDDPQAWDFGTPFKAEGPYPKARPSDVEVATGKGSGLRWTETTGEDADLVDGAFARTAVEWLEKRDPKKPFFLAVGFHRPHLPLVAPAKYFDWHPFESIKLPNAPENDEVDIPAPARNGAVPGYKLSATPEQRRAAIRAYLACVSYVDAQAGFVLDALQRLGIADNTIVIFAADHGWHLGEHGLWHKRSLFEESARVPLLVFAPGMTSGGQRSPSLVELLDLYPTLCDLCGLPVSDRLQGKSLRPLLTDAKAAVHGAVFTEARRGANAEFWGRSVRTSRWRFTQWNEGRDGVELYDHEADQHEYSNLATRPEHAAVVDELATLLADGRTANSDHTAAADKTIDADLVLKGGTLYDGSGGTGVVGDLAIAKGKVVGFGKFKHGNVSQTIDCRGLAITPGFIDLHSHSDSPITQPATRANVNFVTQGCTTVVTGNCGFGPVDVAAYLKKIDTQGAGTNVAHLLPQGSLREEVMQKTARDPSSDELERMRALADRAMRDGAWGMATGLIYVPGTYTKTEELIELAKVVASHGGIYASHIRNEGKQLPQAVEEALEIGRKADLPVHLSHFKASGREAWGSLHLAIELVEQARREGRLITADQYPYTASSTTLEATLLPAWSREGGRKEIERRLADKEDRERIRRAVADRLNGHVRIQIAGYSPRRDWIGRSLEEIAAVDNRPIVDVVLEIEERGGARIVNFGMHEDDVRLAMKLPWVATASDGSAKIPDGDQPHPRNFGTFPRKLGRYVREEKVISLEQAIRSCTGLAADVLHMPERGYLREGYAADVVAFDPKVIADRADYDQPYHYSTGIRYVFVGGVPTLFEGVPTGALPGRALRHQSSKK